jgi:hypothetical protein
MRDLLRRLGDRLFDALFPPLPPFEDWGLHANARDWPADEPELGERVLLAELAGITPQHASAAAASLLTAGEVRDA